MPEQLDKIQQNSVICRMKRSRNVYPKITTGYDVVNLFKKIILVQYLFRTL